MLRITRLLAVSCAVVLLAAACGNDDTSAPDTGDPADTGTDGGTGGEDLDGSILVFAAASLTDAFAEVGEAFEAANPGVTVEFNFAGSSALREQILAGAPADVFASANISNMDDVVEGGAADSPADFVANQLQIAVPAGNPGGVTGLEDFADEDLFIGLCAEEVPCGSFGRQALDDAGVTPAQDTDEPDVRALLTKLEEGELDAGIVYRTDVLAADGAVEGIDIPAEHNVVAVYPIAILAEAGNPAVAEAFVAFVLSDEGQAILASYGFDGP